MSHNIFICKICGKIYNGLYPIGRHLKNKHNMTVKEYYDIYLKKSGEGICANPNCNNETSFHRISNGYQKFCSNRCQMESYILTNKNGCLDRKIEKELNDKFKHEKCIELYGEDSRTNRVKLYYYLNPSIKNNKHLTNSVGFIKMVNEKYGVNYYSQTDTFKTDKIKRDFNNFKLKNDTNDIYFTNIDYKEGIIKGHCNICNSDFIINRDEFYYRKKLKKCYCTNCNKQLKPISKKSTSNQEKELLSEIKKIYNGIIIENDRKIIHPKELDIYLPDLKLAFEYNGCYWHADPDYFKENDIVHHEKASKIWKNDLKKKIICEQMGITLITIKERHWINCKESVLSFIKNIINTMLGEHL